MTTPTPYGRNPDLWENDPHLLPMTPERRSTVDLIGFRICRSRGLTPEQAYPDDALKQAAYGSWLASQPQAGD